MRRAFSLLLLLAFSVQVSAAQQETQEATPRWVPVSESGAVLKYLDTQRVRPLGGGVYEVWIKTEEESPKSLNGGRQYDESKTLERYDCKRRTLTIHSVAFYLRGEEFLSFTIPSSEQEERNIVPGSVGELTLDMVCEAR